MQPSGRRGKKGGVMTTSLRSLDCRGKGSDGFAWGKGRSRERLRVGGIVEGMAKGTARNRQGKGLLDMRMGEQLLQPGPARRGRCFREEKNAAGLFSPKQAGLF